MFKIFLIGIADSQLSAWQEQLLQRCSLIIGAKRFAGMASGFSAKFVDITPLQGAMAALHSNLTHGNVAVLASGDPLFYGIGRRLLGEFPGESVAIFPALTSIQRACALFRLPWDDATITSLHGRNVAHLPGLLLGHAKHLLLTDASNSPDRLARLLLEYLALVGETELPGTIDMLVAEDLGLASEKVFRGSLAEASHQQFSALNITCLQVPGLPAAPSHRFGLTEELLHHSRGLITKNEVRAATLHRLCLPATGVFWDVGAGSGSLSIEAARTNPRLTVYAVEQKEEELKNIKKNIVKFRCFNIVPVSGRAPEALAGLPDPHRVFIGGSSGALPAIVPAVAARLVEGGILVINGVVDSTVQAAPMLMRGHGFSVETATVQVSRTGPDGITKKFNPITIMTGTKMSTNSDTQAATAGGQHPVHFVGAGPGDPELITVKGQRLLQEADLVIFTGSLVPRTLLAGLRAEIRDSAGMDLDAVFALILEAWQDGRRIVRLHTGDPSIYGAIGEQIALLRAHAIPFAIVPGVSSGMATAAALGTELTLPEVSQTVIFTRRGGRTPVPEGESLQSLASHQATMMIFLSVGMIDAVVEELQVGGYPADTPVAIVEKVSWPDERQLRGTLATIAGQVKAANITKTALIAVGRVLAEGPPPALSKLYDSAFSHGFRRGSGS